MEILRHGNRYKKGQCPECKCIFQYNRKDIKEYQNSEYHDQYIECPECGLKMIVK